MCFWPIQSAIKISQVQQLPGCLRGSRSGSVKNQRIPSSRTELGSPAKEQNSFGGLLFKPSTSPSRGPDYGSCKLGELCRHAHSKEELRRTPTSSGLLFLQIPFWGAKELMKIIFLGAKLAFMPPPQAAQNCELKQVDSSSDLM